jgi:hypothetical protein
MRRTFFLDVHIKHDETTRVAQFTRDDNWETLGKPNVSTPFTTAQHEWFSTDPDTAWYNTHTSPE